MALGAAGIVLVVFVLPAEYGIDPTGVGRRIGLLDLAGPAKPAEAQAASGVAALSARSAEIFGAQSGQSFDAEAVVPSERAIRSDSLTVVIAPGQGTEVKARMRAGDGMVFQWRASGGLTFDMHGERPEVKDAFTSYAVGAGQREGAGRFVAPFDGHHGWYWRNDGQDPVTVAVQVTGSHAALQQPARP